MDSKDFDEKVYKVFGSRKKTTTENLLREIAIKLNVVTQELQLNRELMQEIKHLLTESVKLQALILRELKKERETYSDRYSQFVELAEKSRFLTAKQVEKELKVSRMTAIAWLKRLGKEKPEDFKYISGNRGGWDRRNESRLVNLRKINR